MNQLTTNSSSIDGLQTRSSLDDNGFALSLCYGDRVFLELVSEDLAGLSAVGMGDFFGSQVYGFQSPYWDKQAFNRSSLEKRIVRAFEVDMERSIDRASIYRTLATMIARVGLLPQETTRLYVSRVKPAGDSDCVAGYVLHSSPEFYKECSGQALEAPRGLGYSRGMAEVYLLDRLLKDTFELEVPDDFQLLTGALMYASMLLKAYYLEAGASHLWGVGAVEDGVAASLRSETDEAKRARLERSRATVKYMMSNKNAAYVLAADDPDGVFTESLKGVFHHFRDTPHEIALGLYYDLFSSVKKDDTTVAVLYYAYKASGIGW